MFSPREAETYKQNQHPIALTKQVNKSTSQQVNKIFTDNLMLTPVYVALC